MSRETMEWLGNNVLRGFTGKRGPAWWNHSGSNGVDGNGEPNHYDGAIPADDIVRRLFAWDAVQATNYADGGSEFGMVKQDHVSWHRSDTFAKLGVHGDGYKGHQYRPWLMDGLTAIVGGGADFANAGLLSGGAIAWVQIEMPDNVETPEGVTVRPFILATTSFDGSIATTYKTGYTDTVCDNTRDMFLREAGEVFRVRHTRNSGDTLNVPNASAALNTLHLMGDTAAQEIGTLCAIDVSNAEWARFVEAHVPIGEDAAKKSVTMAETKRQALTQLWNTDVRVAPWAGTAWGVVQAVNTYTHHMSIVRNVNARFERNISRAVKGETANGDRAALATLATVMGRELIPA